MSWIKLTGFSIIAAIFLALFYLCLITADFVLFRYLGSHLRDPEAESIIAARFQSDINLAQEARRSGYLPLVFPDYSSSDEEYIALSNAYNIFPLGALPNTNTYFCNEGYGLILGQIENEPTLDRTEPNLIGQADDYRAADLQSIEFSASIYLSFIQEAHFHSEQLSRIVSIAVKFVEDEENLYHCSSALDPDSRLVVYASSTFNNEDTIHLDPWDQWVHLLVELVNMVNQSLICFSEILINEFCFFTYHHTG